MWNIYSFISNQTSTLYKQLNKIRAHLFSKKNLWKKNKIPSIKQWYKRIYENFCELQYYFIDICKLQNFSYGISSITNDTQSFYIIKFYCITLLNAMLHITIPEYCKFRSNYIWACIIQNDIFAIMVGKEKIMSNNP